MSDVTLFNYAGLSGDDATFARVAAERIKVRMKRTVEDVIAIGQDLIAVKERLPHGEFGDWIEAEFGMDERVARRFMQVAETYGGKSDNLSDLKPSIVYALAAPSTPEPVREAIEVRAAGGHRVKFADVAELKRRYENEVQLRESLQGEAAELRAAVREGASPETIVIEKEPDAEWMAAEIERMAAEKTGDMKAELDRAKREADEAKRIARDAKQEAKEAESKATAAARAGAEKMAAEELAKIEKRAADAKKRERDADAAVERKGKRLDDLKKQERDLHAAVNGYGGQETETKEIARVCEEISRAAGSAVDVFQSLEHMPSDRASQRIDRCIGALEKTLEEMRRLSHADLKVASGAIEGEVLQ